MFDIWPKISFFSQICLDKLGNLETRIDVVAKLTAELVHTRAHCRTLGLNIPEGGDCQDGGVEMFLLTFFYAKHRALISLAVETSLVTAYFTSKATFVQMFKCFQQYGGQAELIKL